MGRLFLPGLVVSAENQGTFSDYHWFVPSSNCDIAYCGSFGLLRQCGLFACDFRPLNNISDRAHWGSRLSKN